MISLTESAIAKVKNILLADEKRKGIRATVRGGGCSGFQYALEIVYEPQENDREFIEKSVSVFVDPKSLLYLLGTQIDYVDELNTTGFKFVNPNAKRTCGCGESFSV